MPNEFGLPLVFSTGEFVERNRLPERIRCQPVGMTSGSNPGAAGDKWILRPAGFSIQAVFVFDHAGRDSKSCGIGVGLNGSRISN